MNTKAEVLAKILADLPTNGTNAITATILRTVLNFMADHETLAEDVLYENEYHPAIETVSDALVYLIESNIPTWEDKAYPDNFTVYYDGALYRSIDIIQIGDGQPDGSAVWELVSGTGGDDMTPEEIVTALETLAINAALNSTKIRFATGVSVFAQITAMVLDITAKQQRLYNSRFFVAGSTPSVSFTITSQLLHPVNMFLNGKYYNGRHASNFNPPFSSYDFRYEHSGNNTVFYFNPLASGSPQFAPGDTVDLVHSSLPIGDPE